MSDDIRAMTSELARDPGSLVFIPLGEALRARGQIEAARKVIRAGLERNPDSTDAHDLHARLLVDVGDLEGAEREWSLVLSADARHLGAHKGLGFLCYRRGDVDGALDHLELALSVDPADPNVLQALQTVRGVVAEGGRSAPAVPARHGEMAADTGPFSGVEGADRAMLLVDPRGRVLGGGLRNPAGIEVAETVAAQLAGVSQEAERTVRVLELGEWSSIVAEAADGNMFLCQALPDTILLLVRDRSVPPARMQVIAEKAAEQARAWIAGQTP
ncbi:MAG: tetratricopeptide repeat protein [Gemmatimonadetes bacterium]|nr:tetratricopeptide repeat protein [Gemmatimonadota bacterium]